EEVKAEEVKAEEVKAEEVKSEEVKSEEVKSEGVGQDSSDDGKKVHESLLSSIQLVKESPTVNDESPVKSIDELELPNEVEKENRESTVDAKVPEEKASALGSVLSAPYVDEVGTGIPNDAQEKVVIASDEALVEAEQAASTEQIQEETSSKESPDDSYAWSLSSLPGYGDSKEPTLPEVEVNPVLPHVEQSLPEQNPILSSDKRFRKYLPKSLRSALFGRSSNYTVYTLLSILVFSFLGLFGILYYQDQSLKLEQSMHKYDIVKMEPYKAPAKIEEKKQPAISEEVQETKLAEAENLAEAEQGISSEKSVSEPESTVSLPKKSKPSQPVKTTAYTKKVIQPKVQKPSVVVNIESVPVEPYVQNAYQALYAGDFEKAEDLFKNALQDNAEDVDALNGLGAVYAQMNMEEQALKQYYKVLEISSDNIHAFEAIISLVGSNLSGQDWKREIKRVLIKHPDSSILNYALGNIYAQEGDWEKAQSAYFDAHRLDQQNPDYLVNLAISLDHLGKYALAEKYYTLGLVHSESKTTNFDVEQVKLRLASIKQYIGQNDL
ncbi:tetratricopeptide repeat protein, partial [Thiomicrorhabdus sp. ZW0627]|uniref:tetratricopeptide repeat protein n=1 Tax=Thiomicrorhabdus sp. ZW0627 TaxID=3039774 RepID=UPI00243661A7